VTAFFDLARNARRAALALSLSLGLSHVACGGDQRLPPAAPALETPADALPPELDWVLRVDVGRVRSALGTVFVELAKRSAGEGGDPQSRFVSDALERTNVLVAAFRYENDRIDLVVAAEGDFKGLDPRQYALVPPWKPPLDLGGDVRRYDRGKPKKRSDPARLYLKGDRLLILVSEAALDSVEAVVERHAPASSLAPPTRGILSGAARIRGRPGLLSFERFPAVSEAMRSLRSVEAWVDSTPQGFEARVMFELGTGAEATAATVLFERAKSAFAGEKGRAAELIQHARVEAKEQYVVVHLDLPLEVFGKALGDVVR
jgi:hypothetical protein